jgi:hypothetical protein
MTTNPNDAIIQEAAKAAAEATETYLKEHPGQWFPCGFAWVTIKPARGKLVERMKQLDIGKRDSYEGGFKIWNPSGNPTQCMDAKVAGAEAYAKVLKAHGVTCSTGSRWD